MVTEVDPRDQECAMLLGYYCYHYDKDHPSACYWQLWDAMSDPVRDPEATGRAWGLPMKATEAEAWSLCPRFHSSMEACREILDRVCEADESHRALYTTTLMLQPDLAGVSPSELYLRMTPEAIAAAFVYVGKLRAWNPPKARGGFGEPEPE